MLILVQIMKSTPDFSEPTEHVAEPTHLSCAGMHYQMPTSSSLMFRSCSVDILAFLDRPADCKTVQMTRKGAPVLVSVCESC